MTETVQNSPFRFLAWGSCAVASIGVLAAIYLALTTELPGTINFGAALMSSVFATLAGALGFQATKTRRPGYRFAAAAIIGVFLLIAIQFLMMLDWEQVF